MRVKISFFCKVCNRQNYDSKKNKTKTPKKMSLLKYCKQCRKRVLHVEKK